MSSGSGGLPNPILPGFNPDPSVVRVGDVFYIVTSTFEYLPALPVYRSTDFRDWQLVGHVVTRRGQLVSDVPTGAGVWAPTIRHRNGRFYVIVTQVLGRGTVVFTADRAEGPWCDGTVIEGIDGIDPDLAWDENGTAIVTYSASAGDGLIEQVRVDLATGQALETPRVLWSGSLAYPEAPHLYDIDGWWYLVIAEGGTERGHSVSVARSRQPDGPFDPAPGNPVLCAAGTGRAVQCTGHGDLVRGPDGEWLLVLLGTRPKGAFSSFSALGRETWVTTVTWEDAWPKVAPVGLSPRPGVVHDDFDGAELDGRWIAVRRFPAEVAELRESRLVLRDGRPLTDPLPALIGMRQQHLRASASIRIDTRDGVGGLVLRYTEHDWYAVTAGRGVLRAETQLQGLTSAWTTACAAHQVELTIRCVPSVATGLLASTMEDVQLVATLDDQEVVLVTVDGRYLSSEVVESFTGRLIGIVATEGTVAIEWFNYEGADE